MAPLASFRVRADMGDFHTSSESERTTIDLIEIIESAYGFDSDDCELCDCPEWNELKRRIISGAAQAAPEPTIDQFGGLIEHYLRYTISTKEGRFTARNLLNQFEIRPRAGAHSSTNSGDAT